MAKKRANGEGNIRKRKDGRWEGRYTAGYDPETGKRIIKNVLGKTQAEVKAKLSKAIENSRTLDIGRADEYTVATWLRAWFELYAKPHVRPSTADYYRRSIELHVTPAIGDIPLGRLTTRDLQRLYRDLQEHGRLREVQKKSKPGLSTSTVRNIHQMIGSAYNLAAQARHLPKRGILFPKEYPPLYPPRSARTASLTCHCLSLSCRCCTRCAKHCLPIFAAAFDLTISLLRFAAPLIVNEARSLIV